MSKKKVKVKAKRRSRKPPSPPRKFTAAIRKKVLVALEQGNYRYVAASHAGISTVTLAHWLKCGRDDAEADPPKDTVWSRFYDDVLKAEGEAERVIVSAVHRAAKGDPEIGLKFLGRRHPKRWGDRSRVAIDPGEGPLEVNHSGRVDLYTSLFKEAAGVAKDSK